MAALRDGLDPAAVRVLRAPCMGRCDTAPVAEVGHFHVDHATPATVRAAVEAGHTHPVIPDYEDFAAYVAGGGYATLAALRGGARTPEAVQETLLAAGRARPGRRGLSGRAEVGLRAGEPGPRYLAVNGDEGEPGTFKDRYYLERTPHLMLEGMLIAAWAVEAERIYVYMRDEYPAVLEILRREIAALGGGGRGARRATSSSAAAPAPTSAARRARCSS